MRRVPRLQAAIGSRKALVLWFRPSGRNPPRISPRLTFLSPSTSETNRDQRLGFVFDGTLPLGPWPISDSFGVKRVPH